jgi:putative transposase
MKRGRFSEEQIVGILKERGGTKDRGAGSGARCHRGDALRPESRYSGVGEAQRLKSLEDENRRLKQLVADLSLDKEALKAIVPTKRVELAGLRAGAAFAMKEFAMSKRRASRLVELTAVQISGRIN